jgi:hypothetical protein
MSKQPAHRPHRRFKDATRVILESEFETCIHCGETLVLSGTYHMRKYVQTLEGPIFLAGKSKQCANPDCVYAGVHYHTRGALRYSLPFSTYGLDVLSYIGWQHDHEHKQLREIQRQLNEQGIIVSERTVGRLYRQFLALLGGSAQEKVVKQLQASAAERGGVVWAIDALQPQGHGTLLYVLYDALSGTPVSALQASYPTAEILQAWIEPYRAICLPVLATLSDGENQIIAALKGSWPDAPHQRCQSHVLGNLAEAALKEDTDLRGWMKQDLGGLAAVPTEVDPADSGVQTGQAPESPLF